MRASRSARFVSVAAVFALTLLGVVGVPTVALAATLTVTSSLDDGPGTLRAVVAVAAAGDVIEIGDGINEITLRVADRDQQGTDDRGARR